MLIFTLVTLVLILLVFGWVRSAGKKKKAPDTQTHTYAAHTQLRGIEPLEHSTGHDFGLLLKAARGDRSVVEKWITTTQHQQMPPLTRDDAVAELARRLRSTRS
ncbi:hypothetical protein [uncultured Aquitalea sp.]|uniref:hypothetical protein n=1 Tax=uncultured Aquitalea sp. TaxID=540272 RepID=UPI0025CBFD8B|nr:hypothetical protein [uncultured Aquitalea sp.]